MTNSQGWGGGGINGLIVQLTMDNQWINKDRIWDNL